MWDNHETELFYYLLELLDQLLEVVKSENYEPYSPPHANYDWRIQNEHKAAKKLIERNSSVSLLCSCCAVDVYFLFFRFRLISFIFFHFLWSAFIFFHFLSFSFIFFHFLSFSFIFFHFLSFLSVSLLRLHGYYQALLNILRL